MTVIEKSYPNDKWGRVGWLCKCDCGTEKIIRGDNLRSGHNKSCGCFSREVSGDRFRLAYGLASMRRVIRKYKQNGKIRGFDYELTEEQFAEITQKDCHYCGARPGQTINGKRNRNNGDYIYNGIDRIDNIRGYTIDNVVPCCGTCNRAKGRMILQKYKDWIKRSYNKMFNESK